MQLLKFYAGRDDFSNGIVRRLGVNRYDICLVMRFVCVMHAQFFAPARDLAKPANGLPADRNELALSARVVPYRQIDVQL